MFGLLMKLFVFFTKFNSEEKLLIETQGMLYKPIITICYI